PVHPGPSPQRHRLARRRIGSLLRGAQPGLVLAEQLPDRRMMLGLVGLEVEIERDDRPVVAPVLLERLLDDRTDALEKVLAHARFAAGEGSPGTHLGAP